MERHEIKRRYEQALEQARGGDLQAAQKTLKGVDHPKARELLTKVEQRLAEQRGSVPTANRHILLIGGLVAGVAVILIGATWFLSSRGNTGPTIPSSAVDVDTNQQIEAISPTDEVCDGQTIQAWWTPERDRMSDFNQVVEMTKFTTDLERYADAVEDMEHLLSDVTPIPPCANEDVVRALSEAWPLMDEMLVQVRDYAANGYSPETSELLDAAQASFRSAQTDFRREVTRQIENS